MSSQEKSRLKAKQERLRTKQRELERKARYRPLTLRNQELLKKIKDDIANTKIKQLRHTLWHSKNPFEKDKAYREIRKTERSIQARETFWKLQEKKQTKHIFLIATKQQRQEWIAKGLETKRQRAAIREIINSLTPEQKIQRNILLKKIALENKRIAAAKARRTKYEKQLNKLEASGLAADKDLAKFKEHYDKHLKSEAKGLGIGEGMGAGANKIDKDYERLMKLYSDYGYLPISDRQLHGLKYSQNFKTFLKKYAASYDITDPDLFIENINNKSGESLRERISKGQKINWIYNPKRKQ